MVKWWWFVWNCFAISSRGHNGYVTIQYSSRLSWHSLAVNMYVFLNFCCDLSQNTRVTWNRLHVSQLLCTAHELFFVRCMRVIIRVLHISKKHASNALCPARESVFLCAACKLTVIFCQAYNKKAPQQNMIECMDTKKSQVFTYPYFRWHFYWTNWMPNMITAQGLDSTGINNLTHLVAQCTRVLCHKAQLRDLNWGTNTPFLIAYTTFSLHN